MSIIYEPKGRALEYGNLAANLFTGCQHGCKYCYVPSAMRKKANEFNAISEPRKDILKLIEKEAPKHQGQEVFLCFTCDPYGYGNDVSVTREAIKILHAAGVGVNILTKGGLRSTKDFDLFCDNPTLSWYGATLTFGDLNDSLLWEPRAATPISRIHALKAAHGRGIRTWASLEPVIDPEQSLELIRRTHRFIDVFRVGKWNHDKRANDIDWKAFANDAKMLLEQRGARYHIKADLARYLNE